jgi:putative membrane protein
MARLFLATSAVLLAALTPVASLTPAFAQSLPEKTGVNSALGVAPKTADFVTQAAQSDMLEIASGKLALTKSDSEKTKQFAQQMIKDHTETSNGLKALVTGGKTNVTLPAAMDRTHQDKLDRLSKLNGREFTKEYDDMQVAAHKDAVSLFERYGKGGDNADLKAFASKTLPNLQHHLMMAQDLGR